jgi:hypothetical protein
MRTKSNFRSEKREQKRRRKRGMMVSGRSALLWQRIRWSRGRLARHHDKVEKEIENALGDDWRDWEHYDPPE